MSTIVVGVIINPNASKSGNEEEVQAEGKIGRERERERGATGCGLSVLSVSDCVAILWCRDV